MRALPGRDARSDLREAPELTRETVAQEQRRRIRRAIGELVAKRGYSGVSVELITRRAKVSFKTFYKHYSSKEDAFADLFDTAVAATGAQVREALETSSVEWPQQVAIAMRTFFEAILAEPLIARALLVEGPTAGPVILGSLRPDREGLRPDPSPMAASTTPTPMSCPRPLRKLSPAPSSGPPISASTSPKPTG